jgi:hypothetical protein
VTAGTVQLAYEQRFGGRLMDPVTIFDVANATPSTAQKFLIGLDDDELFELAWDLCRMYAYASRRLLSDMGYMANMAALHEIRDYGNNWGQRHAAQLILSLEMTVNAPSTTDPYGDRDDNRVPASLRAEGAYDLEKKWHVLGVVDAKVAAISAIPRLWNYLLPTLRTRVGQSMLQHFVTVELVSDDDE